MNIAILDDDIIFLNLFKKQLSAYLDNDVPLTYTKPENLLTALKNREFDVIFLDIEMPETDGLTIARQLYQDNCHSMIVFITNRSELVYKAFGLNIIGFIVKSEMNDQLPHVMDKINTELQSMHYITVETKEKSNQKIQISNILFGEIVTRKVFLYLLNGKRIELKTRIIGEIYQLLPEKQFIFCNRSCFVNIKMVERITDYHLFLKNQTDPIDISSARRKDIKNAYFNERFL